MAAETVVTDSLPTMSHTGRTRPGRPRDTDIDDRILVAAAEVWAERGWTGFNFDVIAKRASVSKDAIYRRYSVPLVLLVASWNGPPGEARRRHEYSVPETASIGDYLVAVARDHLEMFSAE